VEQARGDVGVVRRQQLLSADNSTREQKSVRIEIYRNLSKDANTIRYN
jgi:hypothetical protein